MAKCMSKRYKLKKMAFDEGVVLSFPDLRIRRQHSSESMSSINSAASHSSMGSLGKDAEDKKKKKKSWVRHSQDWEINVHKWTETEKANYKIHV